MGTDRKPPEHKQRPDVDSSGAQADFVEGIFFYTYLFGVSALSLPFVVVLACVIGLPFQAWRLKGQEGVFVTDGVAWLTTDDKATYEAADRIGDNFGVRHLVSAGKVYRVQKGAPVLILSAKENLWPILTFTYQVRILKGPLAGAALYVGSEQVSTPADIDVPWRNPAPGSSVN